MPVYVRGAERWEIAQEGAVLRTRLGEGAEKEERFPDEQLAYKRRVALIREQQDRGFELEDDEDDSPEVPRQNARLEDAIAQDPTDAARYRLYADWLLERGNPWGEVIALQLADKPRSALARIKELAPLLFAGISDEYEFDDFHVARWKWGFVEAVRFYLHEWSNRRGGSPAFPLPVLIRQFLKLPVARFVSEIVVERGADAGCIETIASALQGAGLKTLSLGRFPGGEPLELAGACGRLAALERLDLYGGVVAIGPAAPPRLQHLVLGTTGASCAEILQTLESGTLHTIWLLQSATEALARDVLDGAVRRLPALRSLSVGVAEAGEVDALCGSRLMKTLDQLQLRLRTEAAAQCFSGHLGRLKTTPKLGVSGSAEAMVVLLEQRQRFETLKIDG